MSSSNDAPNVYDRLYDKRSYTGVYRKRFEGDGRINADTQLSLMRVHQPKFEGDTNTKSNETIHSISSLMRPNLNYNSKQKASMRTPTPASASASASAESEFGSMMDAHGPPAEPGTVLAPPVPNVVNPYSSDPHAVLKFVFQYYCRYGRTGAQGAAERSLHNANFVKFCRACPDLLTETFTNTDVDLIFMKAKKKGMRRLSYARFLDALGMIAIQKYPEMELEESVPLLLKDHISKLPCLQEPIESKEDTIVTELSEALASSKSAVAAEDKKCLTTADVRHAVSMAHIPTGGNEASFSSIPHPPI